jgi:serine/threonine protein kinase
MGVVYRGFDPSLQREVAIKVLANAAGADSAKRQRFRSEVEALARFRHPGVVNLHAAGEERGCPYLVMDYVEGEGLDQRLERAPLAPAEAVEVLIPLCRALAACHAAGILHRDLKPDNVLLRRETGAPVLIDFGLAKDISDGALGPTRSGTILGTPGFWSPEQARGERALVGPQTDVYGLGAILYATLTGTAPFTGGSLAEVVIATANRAPKPPSSVVEGVDSELNRICLRCLAKDPGERYAGPAELGRALEDWSAGLEGGASSRLRSLALGVPLLASLGLVVYGLGFALGPTSLKPDESPSVSNSPGASLPGSPSPSGSIAPGEERSDPAPLWLALPVEPPTRIEALDDHHAWVRQQMARASPRVPALVVLGRLVRSLRLGEHHPEKLHDFALEWRRDPARSKVASLPFLVAARAGSPRALQEIGLAFVRQDPGLVRDPAFGERLLIGLVGRGYQAAPLGLGWSYKGRPPGLTRAKASELELAAFALATHFDDPQAKAPARELARTSALPSVAAAWATLRERGLALEERELAPATRRGPPVALPIEERMNVCRESVGGLLTRSRHFDDVHERALALPDSVPEHKTGNAPNLLRGALRGQPAKLWSLGVHYAKHGERPELRPLGRVLLVDAIRAGLERGFGPLARSYGNEHRELATAYASLTAEGRPKDQAFLRALSPSGQRPSRERAWELFWEGYEADRRALGLNFEPPEFELTLPQLVAELQSPRDQEGETARFDELRMRYPALRILQREVGHLQPRRYSKVELGHLNQTSKERTNGLTVAAISIYQARNTGTTSLNFLSEGLSNNTSNVRDPVLGQVLLYLTIAKGSPRGWTHISRLQVRLKHEDLHLAALVLAASGGDDTAGSRVLSVAKFSQVQPPTSWEALALHRRQLAKVLARRPLGVEAWSPRRFKAPSRPEQELRVERIAQMVLARDPLLWRAWNKLEGQEATTLTEVMRVGGDEGAEKRAAALLRFATDHKDPEVMHPLAESLAATNHPTRVKLGWAVLYSRFDVENAGAAFLDVAQAAFNSSHPTLGRALARIAATDPELEASTRLARLSGESPPSLVEAIQVVTHDRERAFLAAGFPCVGWTPAELLEGR